MNLYLEFVMYTKLEVLFDTKDKSIKKKLLKNFI